MSKVDTSTMSKDRLDMALESGDIWTCDNCGQLNWVEVGMNLCDCERDAIVAREETVQNRQEEPMAAKEMIKEQAEVADKLRKIFEIFVNSQGAIRPHFILTGPSGSGKSHLIQVLAAMAGLNFFEINAAQLTKEGMAGNSLSKALTPLTTAGGRPTICFCDEFDKLFISGNNNCDAAHEVTTGVQNEFLRVLEGETTSVFGDYGKYNDVPVDNVLFVFAGAFNGTPNMDVDSLRDFGVKTEFLGRVPLVYNLEKLSLDSLRIALDHSKLFKLYSQLFQLDEYGVQEAKEAIMDAVREEYDNNTLGIRILHTLTNQYFINDGELTKKEVERSTFQTTMKLGGG